LVHTESFIDGPRVEMVMQYRTGAHTTLKQRAILTAGSRRLDFVTTCHWREPKAMLRTSFPVDVHAEKATYEIQFGSMERPTHTNTTWDLAKDECPAQKWADLSQRDYGVALLNDCKYLRRLT
jgi:alpha-mannosidase